MIHQVTTSGTTSDIEWYKEWQRMATSDKEWSNKWQWMIQRVTKSGNFDQTFFFRII